MIGNEFVLALFAGVALAIPYLLYVRRTRHRNRVFGIGLVVAALIYVGFAAFRGNLRELLLECGGVALFGIVAFFGVRYSAWFLALGWTTHVIWDLLLHPAGVSSYVPWWYPVVCIGFDLVAAGAVLGASWREPGLR